MPARSKKFETVSFVNLQPQKHTKRANTLAILTTALHVFTYLGKGKLLAVFWDMRWPFLEFAIRSMPRMLGFDYDSVVNPPMAVCYVVSVNHSYLVLRERRLDLCHKF